jgi:hypothetical protein
MLVIAGLSVLLVAGIAVIVDALSNAGAAHPPTETTRVRLSPLGVDRHGVPLWDHGRRGGAARTERALDWRAAHRGHNARRAAARFRREMAFTNQVRDTRLEHQQRADGTAVTPAPARSRRL